MPSHERTRNTAPSLIVKATQPCRSLVPSTARQANADTGRPARNSSCPTTASASTRTTRGGAATAHVTAAVSRRTPEAIPSGMLGATWWLSPTKRGPTADRGSLKTSDLHSRASMPRPSHPELRHKEQCIMHSIPELPYTSPCRIPLTISSITNRMPLPRRGQDILAVRPRSGA